MMDIANFEQKMLAYDFRAHQRFQTYLRTLEQHGLTIEDATEYVKHKREELVELERASYAGLEQIMPRCPECSNVLMLRPVRQPQGPANVYGWRSCFECPECAYERYSKHRPEDVIKDLYKRRTE
jgi:uncharacterized protein with PIN domain